MNLQVLTPNHVPRCLQQSERKVHSSITKSKLTRVDQRPSSSTKARSTTISPRDVDVLCGRGRGFFEHPGNRRMLAIISKYKPEYQTASKVEKSAITYRVLQLILNPQDGSARPRFLKKENGKKKSGVLTCWSVLCEKEVHKKVAHTLREQKTIVKLPSIALCETPNHMDESSSNASTSSGGDDEWLEDFEQEEDTALQSSMKSSLPSMELSQCDNTQSGPSIEQGTVRRAPEPLGIIRVGTKKSPRHTSIDGCDTYTTDANLVTDDESSASFEYYEVFGTAHCLEERKQQGSSSLTIADEPLGFEQEPIFDEKDIDIFLHTVLNDEDVEGDSCLDSFLDDLMVSL